MIDDPVFLAYKKMKSREFSEKLIASYLFNIKKFLYKIEKIPEQITEDDLKMYLEKDLSNKAGGYPELVSRSLTFFLNEILRSPDEEDIKVQIILSHDQY